MQQQNLLKRIYRKPGQEHQPTSNVPENKVAQNKVLIPSISRKKLENSQSLTKVKPIKLGSYRLGAPKEHNVAAIILNEKADDSVLTHILPKSFNAQNISFNFNPNASVSMMRAKGGNLDESSFNLEKKKSMFQNQRMNNLKQYMKGGPPPKEDKTIEETKDEEYLTPFDFITLLRSDPDMADEFCYLNKRDDPYDWKIIDFDKRNPKEYMTISSRGITHFLDDDATFLTIEEWEREVTMYHKLKQIPFFRDYKAWKNFTLWKHLNRRNMMRDRSQLLTQDLFILDKRLNSTLLKIRQICIEEVSQREIFQTAFEQPVSVEEFLQEQEKFRSSKISLLQEIGQAIEQLIRDSCEISMNSFKTENRIQNRSDGDGTDDPPPLLVGDETNKEMPYTQEATIRTHQKKLRRFIKLIDYIFLEAKMNMIVNSIEKLLNAIKIHNSGYEESQTVSYHNRKIKSGQCMLNVVADFIGTEVTYRPSRDQAKRLFEDCIAKAINLICSQHKQFLHSPKFEVYAKTNDYSDDPADEIINMQLLVKHDPNQKALVEQIGFQLDKAFGFVEDNAEQIVPLLEIYQKNHNMDINIFRQKDIDEVRNSIEVFRGENEQLHELEPTSEIGMYCLDKDGLKLTIKDCATRCLDSLFELMPRLNFERADTLVKRLTDLNNKLKGFPDNVDDFVIFMRNLNMTVGQQEDISEKMNQISEMQILIEEQRLKIRDERHKGRPNEALGQVKRLNERVKNADESMNANMNKFRRELDKAIQQIPPKIQELQDRLGHPMVSDRNANIDEVAAYLAQLGQEVEELNERGKKYNIYQDELQMEVTPFVGIDDFRQEFRTNQKLWNGLKEWNDAIQKWNQTQFLDIPVEDMMKLQEKMTKVATECVKKLELNEVTKVFKDQVEEFKTPVEIISSLKEPALAEKHWKEIKEIIMEGHETEEEIPDFPTALFDEEQRENEELTLEAIMKLNWEPHTAKVQDISVKAIKEKELQKMLDSVKGFWYGGQLKIVEYRADDHTVILGNNDELIEKLDDNLVTITNILSSRYVEGIRKEVELEQKKLSYFQDLLDEWIVLQRNWIYLESIFQSSDIQKQLPAEHEKFKKVNRYFKNHMKQSESTSNISHYVQDIVNDKDVKDHMITKFRGSNETLDKVQKALDDYLETKRKEFARFFFLSNDELLEILSQSKNPLMVEPHLRKCFENINKLEFDISGEHVAGILGMKSAEGEVVPIKNLAISKTVEYWLQELENKMRDTLNKIMNTANVAYGNAERKDWIKQYPSQVVIAVDSVKWTETTEDCLSQETPEDCIGAMYDWFDIFVAQLSELTDMINGELTPIERKRIVALITQDVHYRDIIEQLKNDQVDNKDDFKWQQQLRFYIDDSKCYARQVESKLFYGYEYLGAPSRLVITPLTDRCWMTITGALHIKLGAAPAGPAGTGKTESTKDLAKALGIFCVVFNCSEQITVKMMEKLFTGLCYTGSWACLDEFNRINIEVLSVIAQQVLQIKLAKLSGADHFLFQSKPINLKPDMGIFITMNPGYAGRTELPDNLKVLFRPVAMMVPDYSLIAEIMLYAEGFKEAKDLSRKMTKLYKLSSEQLSQQFHYDFGMRAVKSVLVMAGALKRSEPNLSEDVVLIRAMKDSNIPKFLSHDLPLFNAIITDLFPEAKIPESENAELVKEIREQLISQKLSDTKGFVEKVVQYHETLKVRFGVMLVGPTMAGKSTVLKTLANSYTSLAKKRNATKQPPHPDFKTTELVILNPKSITMEELFGNFDNISQEWTDGLASKFIRDFSSIDTPDKKWVMFDGPVDALWIENMNTVLDDNMMLCLSNGQRIKLNFTMRMLFEVQDLAVASPATVSRCGMVYLDHEVIGIESVIKGYVDNILAPLLPEKYVDHVFKQFSTSFIKATNFTRKFGTEPIATVDSNLAFSVTKIMQALLSNGEFNAKKCADEFLKKSIDRIFLFSFMWGIGGSLEPMSQNKFESNFSQAHPEGFPPGSIYDSFLSFDHKPEGEYQPWNEAIPDFKFDKQKSYFELMVPNKDTVRYSWFLKNAISILHSVFFTGVTGAGKTSIMEQMLSELDEKGEIVSLSLTFSAKTDSKMTQLQIENNLNSQRRNKAITLIPPPAKKLVVMVDDINMPSVEEYGAQPPIEMLRFFQDKKGLFDRTGLFFKEVESTVLLSAAAPPGGGRSNLTPRFTRHFQMICLPPSSEESLTLIFKSILEGFLKSYTFKTEVVQLADKVVRATLDMYDEISKGLLPTPSKSHYTFNLRDVSKVFQGILMTKPPKGSGTPISIPNSDSMAKLWIHETCRVFFDRLVDETDRQWFKDTIARIWYSQFGVEWSAKEIFEENLLIFGDFMRKGVEADERIYEEVRDYSKLPKIIDDYMAEAPQPMNLVLFRDAMEHLCRVSRILRFQRGHAMLIGLGGSGKQSITRLAALMAECRFEMIKVNKSRPEQSFREDLFENMKQAVIESPIPIVYFVPDTMIIKESFLEDINNLLNSGEVPNMLNRDQMIEIKKSMPDVMKQDGVMKESYAYWVEKVRSHLHIVLAMSPVGEKLRTRLRMFPSLVNCCTIDWIKPWPEDALLSVSTMKLEKIEMNSVTPEIKANLAQLAMFAHITIEQEAERFYNTLKRKVYTTPKSYIDLLQSYFQFLKEKNAELSDYRNKLSNGLTKLAETNESVIKLNEDLKKLEPQLIKMKSEQDVLIQKIAKDKGEANQVREVVEAEERVVNEQKREIEDLKMEADKVLKAALPTLEDAKKALDLLTRQDLTEIKTNPNPLIKFTWKCVAILLGNEKPDEAAIKKLHADAGLIDKMKTMDYEHIPENIQRKVKMEIKSNDQFEPDIVAGIQKSAKNIVTWVKAVADFTDIAKEINQKKSYVEEMSAKLDKANAALETKQAELNKVQKKVDDLEAELNDNIKKNEKTVKDIDLTGKRLERAQDLITGLADEKDRWAEKVVDLGEDIQRLVGDVFMAAASVVYYGPFTGTFRQDIVDKWHAKCKELEIPCSENYSLIKTLGDPVLIRDWNLCGLPSDSTSVNNAIIVFKTTSFPLMIDPQMQANKWIKSLELKNQRTLRVVKASEGVSKALETSLRMGNPLLIEDLGTQLDSSLEPLLTKQFVIQNNRKHIQIESSLIEYDPKYFSLYQTTKISNPQFLPDVFIRTTVINFTVTELGLEEQLLADVVRKEMPEVEEEKNKLIVSIAQNKQLLRDGENRILELLAKSTGMVVDDVELIRKLKESKERSIVVKENLEKSEETQKTIDAARLKCQPVASRGSTLYFVIADLALIDPMYQFSLAYFTRLFNLVIDTSERPKDFGKRIEILIESITEIIYTNVCRGLFNTHKQLFSFLVSSAIGRRTNAIKAPEWDIFLKGLSLTVQGQAVEPKPSQKLDEKAWETMYLSQKTIVDFEEVVEHMLKNWNTWEEWLSNSEPITAKMPAPYEEKLTLFQKLVLIKVLKVEKSLYSMNLYVLKTLGQKFFTTIPATMEEVFADTDENTPLVFILSPGADPLQNVNRFAEAKGKKEEMIIISLGQGQERAALEGIKDGRINGKWVLLQNCHLAKSFMPKLEEAISHWEDLDNKDPVDSDFRLFLSSMPNDYFPVTVLQNSVKLTNEPPKGLKANMMRTYNDLDQQKLDECEKHPEQWRKLLFALSFFHAIVQERRKFGPLGWNIRYEFNESDLETSITMVGNMLKRDEINWDAIRYMTGEINYGGRVTDEWDRRCLLSVLNIYVTRFMLEDEYPFSKSKTYYSPPDGDISFYRDLIKDFPDIEDPEVFGMHANANIAYELKESSAALETILSIQPRDATAAAGKSPDEIVDELATTLESKLILAIVVNPEEAHRHEKQRHHYIDSVQVCLNQEVERFNRLLAVMRNTLIDLKKAIKGEVVMSAELDMMYQSLLNNQVPDLWKKVSYPSLRPLSSWFEDLQARCNFFDTWLNKGKPKGFWISAFFFPQGFLTSVLQNYARKFKIPIDVLSFGFDFMETTEIDLVKTAPEDGCYIYGLFIEGCRFDLKKGRLEDSMPGVMYTNAPVIYFSPQENYTPDPADYGMPVYKTTTRAGTLSTTGHSTNFIIIIDVPTHMKPDYWILNGAAFMCQLNN